MMCQPCSDCCCTIAEDAGASTVSAKTMHIDFRRLRDAYYDVGQSECPTVKLAQRGRRGRRSRPMALKRKNSIAAPDWTALRLKDRVKRGLRVLFVGINPGVRSAVTGHHFAGYSNRFWKLLYESRLVTEPINHEQDDRLPKWGLGLTNLIARPSPGIDHLRPIEYVQGWKVLDAKIRRYRPDVIALVGVTLYRAILPLITKRVSAARQSVIGPQRLSIHGARVFVLPNPSGRNANFSYSEMLDAFVRLRRFTERRRAALGGM